VGMRCHYGQDGGVKAAVIIRLWSVLGKANLGYSAKRAESGVKGL